MLVIDEDGYAERTSELKEAQHYSGVEFPRAFGIAIRTFDAWMLADERALTTVLGCQIQRQPAPESLIGPKQVCAELRANSGADVSLSEMYAQIAEVAAISLMEERCPVGFGTFAVRVRQL